MGKAVRTLRESLAAGGALTVGMEAPRGVSVEGALAAARALRRRAAAVTVGAGGGGVRMGAVGAALLLRGRAGLEAVPELAPGAGVAARLASDLLGAWALGIDAVLAAGEGGEALRTAAALNRGEGPDGSALGARTDFFIGAEADPAAPRRLRELVAAGAGFLLTGPVFRPRDAEALLAEAGALGVPVLTGILPVASPEELRRLEGGGTGMRLPEEVRDRLAKTPAARLRAEGVELCRELLAELRGRGAGVHLAVGAAPELTAEILGPEPEEREPPRPESPLEAALAAEARSGRLPCPAAFRVAARLGEPVAGAGRAAERLGLRIAGCQLGCF